MARILVNDDDAHIRNTVRRTLESRGHHVTLVSDGAAAEAALAQNPTDLLITDIFMPGQDGIVTLLHVRKTFPALKVIAISGGQTVHPALGFPAPLPLYFRPFPSSSVGRAAGC